MELLLILGVMIAALVFVGLNCYAGRHIHDEPPLDIWHDGPARMEED